jgi:hypothetical protein
MDKSLDEDIASIVSVNNEFYKHFIEELSDLDSDDDSDLMLPQWKGSMPGRAKKIGPQLRGRHVQLYNNYFHDETTLYRNYFRRRCRMSRKLFRRIIEGVIMTHSFNASHMPQVSLASLLTKSAQRLFACLLMELLVISLMSTCA